MYDNKTKMEKMLFIIVDEVRHIAGHFDLSYQLSMYLLCAICNHLYFSVTLWVEASVRLMQMCLVESVQLFQLHVVDHGDHQCEKL